MRNLSLALLALLLFTLSACDIADNTCGDAELSTLAGSEVAINISTVAVNPSSRLLRIIKTFQRFRQQYDLPAYRSKTQDKRSKGGFGIGVGNKLHGQGKLE